MAWPLSRITSYSPGALPTIKAFDLNSIQDAIGSILLGTYSHKALVVDGTGGATAAPVPGSASISGSLSVGGNASVTGTSTLTGNVTIGGNAVISGTARVSATVTGTTTPTPAYARGTLGAGSVIGGWAVLLGDGTLRSGYNVYVTERLAKGLYAVVFHPVPADPTRSAVWATARTVPSDRMDVTYDAISGPGGRQQVAVYTTINGSYEDTEFSVGFFGE